MKFNQLQNPATNNINDFKGNRCTQCALVQQKLQNSWHTETKQKHRWKH